MPGLHVARKLPSPEGTIGELQAILADIVKSVESSTFEPTNNEFTGKITAVIAEINELHDVLMNRLQDTKVDTANSKNTMDDKQRELQDAIYEKRHILEEIQKCRQLRTVFQHLELLPLDTFFATAPAHYAGRDQTEHAQMINRLLFEKEERASLKEEEEKLEEERRNLIKASRKEQDKLDRYDKLLDDFALATEPLVEALQKHDEGLQSNAMDIDEPSSSIKDTDMMDTNQG